MYELNSYYVTLWLCAFQLNLRTISISYVHTQNSNGYRFVVHCIGVMSDSVHSLVLVINSPFPFPGLSYVDYEFIFFIYMYIYWWIFKEAKKNSSELPWRYPFLQLHCKVVTGPVSHHCIWPWSDLNLDFIYSAIMLPPCWQLTLETMFHCS